MLQLRELFMDGCKRLQATTSFILPYHAAPWEERWRSAASASLHERRYPDEREDVINEPNDMAGDYIEGFKSQKKWLLFVFPEKEFSLIN